MILHSLKKPIVEDDTDGENYDTLLPNLLSGVPSVGITENLAQSAG